MTCVCDQQIFNYKVVILTLNTSYCCPVGSSLINGSCGCDSTGNTKSYIGVPTGANLVFNPLAVSPLTRFICVP